MLQALATGDFDTARTLQARSVTMIAVAQPFGGVAAFKAMMAMLGLDCGPVRPPLRNLTAEENEQLRKALEAIDFFSPQFCQAPAVERTNA